MRHLRLSFLLIFSAFLLQMVWAPASHGRPFRLEKLPDGGSNWACATCHINPNGGGPRNAFGQDYEAIALPAGDVYTEELGQKDSDGDGISNDNEFNANPPTEPWNSESPAPIVTAVEARRKVLMMWARLKSVPSGTHLNSTRPTAPFPLKTLRNTGSTGTQQKRDLATLDSATLANSQESMRLTVLQSVGKFLERINAKSLAKRNAR